MTHNVMFVHVETVLHHVNHHRDEIIAAIREEVVDQLSRPGDDDQPAVLSIFDLPAEERDLTNLKQSLRFCILMAAKHFATNGGMAEPTLTEYSDTPKVRKALYALGIPSDGIDYLLESNRCVLCSERHWSLSFRTFKGNTFPYLEQKDFEMTSGDPRVLGHYGTSLTINTLVARLSAYNAFSVLPRAENYISFDMFSGGPDKYAVQAAFNKMDELLDAGQITSADGLFEAIDTLQIIPAALNRVQLMITDNFLNATYAPAEVKIAEKEETDVG